MDRVLRDDLAGSRQPPVGEVAAVAVGGVGLEAQEHERPAVVLPCERLKPLLNALHADADEPLAVAGGELDRVVDLEQAACRRQLRQVVVAAGLRVGQPLRQADRRADRDESGALVRGELPPAAGVQAFSPRGR